MMIEKQNSNLSTLLWNISSAADKATIEEMIGDIATSYGLTSAAYLGIGIGKTRNIPYLTVTYSSDWVEHYKRQRYFEVDPVVQQGFRRLLPSDWEECGSPEGDLRRFFGEASEFGLGPRGITIPIHGRGGDRSLFTITSDASDHDWEHARFEYMQDFQVLAVHLHEKVLQLEGHSLSVKMLSPRELECLQWVSEGKTTWECAVILDLSAHTVRCYLERARYKLG